MLLLDALMVVYLLCGLRNSGQTYELNIKPLQNEIGTYYESAPMTLTPGAYRVYVNYSASHDRTNLIEVISQKASYGALKTNPTILYAGQTSTSYVFWLHEKVDDLQVKVTYGGEGSLVVSDGSLVKTNLLERQQLLFGCLLLLILNVGIYLYDSRKVLHCENWKIAVLLIGIIVGTSIPLTTDYILPGADMTFHLLRIEGVKDALTSGQFPVRIHPNWLQGHGYAAGIFYSDLFLYIPAFLRIMGMTVQGAYKCYKFVVNAATCLIAFYSFSKIFKSKMLGILGSFLYTFQVVRLIYIYGVDGVGQFTAFVFLPLIVYGFYLILTKDTTDEDYKYSFVVLTLGLTGIVESHVLTCAMVALFIILLCLICIPRIRNPKVFLELCKTVGATLLLNAWYLVPFLDYTVSMPFAITKGAATLKQIQTWGMYIPQMFEAFPLGGQYGASDAKNGIPGETAYGLGLGLTIAFIVILFIRFVWKEKKQSKLCDISLTFGVLALFLSTIYFPWDKLARCHTLLKQMIATLQFASRFMTIAPLFILLAFLCCLQVVERASVKKWLAGAVVAGTLVTALFFHNTMLSYTEGLFRIYDETCMGNGYISGAEYILLETDTDKLTYKNPVISPGITFNSWTKEGCHVTLDCDMAAGNEGYIELPLLYYKGYQAVETGGKTLDVVCGDNNVVRVIVPSGFQGIIEVDFESPWYWRLAEVISVGMLAVLIFIKRKNVQRREQV